MLATVAASGVFFWARTAPDSSRDTSCDALGQATREAMASGDLDQAEWSLAQAESICTDGRLDALGPLASEIAAVRNRDRACDEIGQQASTLIKSSLPGQAKRQLADAHDTCEGHPAYEAATAHSARAIREAADLISRGLQQIGSSDTTAADVSLTRALKLDSQASGATQLQESIARTRREEQDAPAVDPAAPSAWQQPPPAQARREADSIVAELLNDGKRALARGNYAEAKSHAKSALRLSPGHRGASELLSTAEADERRALQEIIIN